MCVVFRTDHSDATTDSAACSLSSGDSCSVQDDDSEDFMYSVSNPPTPNQTRKKMTSDAESENTFVSGTSSHSSSSTHTMSSTDKQSSMFTNSTEAVLGEAASSSASTSQKFLLHKYPNIIAISNFLYYTLNLTIQVIFLRAT